MEKPQAGRIILGGVLVVASTLLFFSAAKVALSARTGPQEEFLQRQVDPALKQKLFHAPSVTPQPAESTALNQDDLDRVFADDLIAVVGPAGSTPEELIRTILQDTTLPRHIREPFVKLARAKAPHLLTGQEEGQF